MRSVLFFVCICFSTGCVTHNLTYTPPTDYQKTNSKTISMSFKKTWEQLVEGLAQQNFVIESLNKDSGLIVVSKKLGPPSTFADCGRWIGNFKNARTDETYNFSGAEAATYVAKNRDGSTYSTVSRIPSLTSKSNIFVKKLTNEKTSIAVNSQFSLKLDISTRTQSYPQGVTYHQDTASIDWTTQDRGTINMGGKTQCVSTFYLEESILGILK